MNPVRTMLPLLMSTALVAQGDIPVPSAPDPFTPAADVAADLVIKYPPELVEITIVGQPGSVYFGAIIVSLSATQVPLFEKGPLALTNFAVLATGVGEPLLTVAIPHSAVFPGVLFHTQGLLLAGGEVTATPVRTFVLDASAPLPVPPSADVVEVKDVVDVVKAALPSKPGDN